MFSVNRGNLGDWEGRGEGIGVWLLFSHSQASSLYLLQRPGSGELELVCVKVSPAQTLRENSGSTTNPEGTGCPHGILGHGSFPLPGDGVCSGDGAKDSLSLPGDGGLAHLP